MKKRKLSNRVGSLEEEVLNLQLRFGEHITQRGIFVKSEVFAIIWNVLVLCCVALFFLMGIFASFYLAETYGDIGIVIGALSLFGELSVYIMLDFSKMFM